MIVERTLMAAKVEAVEGTKETLANTDVFISFAPAFDPDIETTKRNPMRDSLSQYPAVSGKRSGKMSFDFELCSTGAAGTALVCITALMKGCGFAETVNAANWVKYLPASSGWPSLTLARYDDSIGIKRIWGARGNVKFTWEAGKAPMAHFDFQGADFEVVDGAFPGTLPQPPPTAFPPAILAPTFTVDAYAALIAKVDLDMGIKLARRVDMNSTSGYKSVMITGRDPVGNFDPEDVTVATYDIFGKWKAPGTMGALSFIAGSAAGSILSVSLPKVRHLTVKPGEREGVRVNAVSFQATPSAAAADDEITLMMY